MEGNYCAYLRKSRKDLEAEARGEGETLARHEHILLDLAHRMNISLEAIYKEVVSGETISARPVMQQLLREVEEGVWTGVLVVEIERLARGDTRDQGYVAEAFTYSDTKIITPLKTYDPADPADQEYFEFNLFMSRREYKTINRRLETGRHQSFLEGKFLGNVAPYGWERYKLDRQKGFSLRPHPQEGKYLVMIYDLVAYGSGGTPMGPDQVANLFNSMGVPSRTGSGWTGATIRGIIGNEHNIGLVRRGRRKTVKKMQNGNIVKLRPHQKSYELADGLHAGQVSEEVFRLANENIHSSAPPVNRDYTVKNPLAGLIVCSCCGHVMRRRPTHVRAAYDFLYCPYSCETIGAPLYLVEDAVLDMLKGWTEKYQLQRTAHDDRGSQELIHAKQLILSEKEDALEKLKKQIAEQRASIDKLERDQQRLGQLVANIDKVLAQRKAEAEKRAQDARKKQPASGRVSVGGRSPGVFAKQRGKLLMPALGKITGRYGQARANASGKSTTWRGLMIQARQGSDVLACANGQVVFSDWLRGFGNLIIIDLGDGYLSIYANNESLYKSVGDRVSRGDTIASVGNTGGDERPGLYFELRRNGQPFNPLPWIGKD